MVFLNASAPGVVDEGGDVGVLYVNADEPILIVVFVFEEVGIGGDITRRIVYGLDVVIAGFIIAIGIGVAGIGQRTLNISMLGLDAVA